MNLLVLTFASNFSFGMFGYYEYDRVRNIVDMIFREEASLDFDKNKKYKVNMREKYRLYVYGEKADTEIIRITDWLIENKPGLVLKILEMTIEDACKEIDKYVKEDGTERHVKI